MAFRPAGGPPVAVPRIWAAEPEVVSQGPNEAEIQQLIAGAEQKAYAAGHAAGLAAGVQQAKAQVDPVITNLECVIQQLAALAPRVRHEAEAGTVELAIAVARRVLHRELATDPEAILGLVKSAVARLNVRETRRLRISPSDLAMIEAHRSRLNLPPAVEVAADSSLVAGSAIFETARGEMDASVHSQLDEIQRGLTDVVRRHRT